MILQLDPPIPVETPLGEGWALLVIDPGPAWNTCWVVAFEITREIKHFDSNDVKVQKNYTYKLGTETPKNP